MIIGISGVAGSGKDTLADMLVVRGHTKVALADPIKRAVHDMFAFSYTQLWGPSAARNEPDKRYPREHTWDERTAVCLCCGASAAADEQRAQCYLTPRYALQTLGTEWGRHAYSNVWVDYLIRVAEMVALGVSYSARYGLDSMPETNPRHGRPVVVPDVRFENEMAALRAAGAYLIRIKRQDAGLGGAHSSETEQAAIPDSAFDMIVENDGGLEELKQTADLIRDSIKG